MKRQPRELSPPSSLSSRLEGLARTVLPPVLRVPLTVGYALLDEFVGSPPRTRTSPAIRPHAETLPRPAALNLSDSVGVKSANFPRDVRQVQDRLHKLGFLGEAHYAAERADPAQKEALTAQSLPWTLEALRAFQRNVVGKSDGKVDPRGATAFSLSDPTYGTRTTFNPRASEPTAGVPLEKLALSRPTEQIVRAIEAVETGTGRLGESPALLRNASGTPASFGRAQLIGSSAVEVLQAYPAVAQHYGLDAAKLKELDSLASRTSNRYQGIVRQVPRGGVTEAELQRRIAKYTTSQGAAFRQETGLRDTDIEHMFRAAQLKAQLSGYRDTATAMRNPEVAANIQALGLRTSDVKTYVAHPQFHGEHRAGFVTRALFTSPEGQALRNAMTDNGGIPLSRGLIKKNYEEVSAHGRRQLKRTLTPREAAEATLFVHNHGPSGLSQLFKSFGQKKRKLDPYVARALRHWTVAP